MFLLCHHQCRFANGKEIVTGKEQVAGFAVSADPFGGK
jgi:hypothetical protein